MLLVRTFCAVSKKTTKVQKLPYYLTVSSIISGFPKIAHRHESTIIKYI